MPGRTRMDLYRRSRQVEMPEMPGEEKEQGSWSERPDARRLWPRLLTGLLAGAAATWIMTNYQVKSEDWLKQVSSPANEQHEPGGQSQAQRQSHDNPTVTVAHHLSRALRGRDVSQRHKQLAGNLVHYGFGTLNGALFALLSDLLPWRMPLRGLAFGAGLWAAADETTLPALGFSGWWPDYPVSAHVKGLAAHLVYGLSLDLIHSGMREVQERIALPDFDAVGLAEAEDDEFLNRPYDEVLDEEFPGRSARPAAQFRPRAYRAEEAYEQEQPGRKRAA